MRAIALPLVAALLTGCAAQSYTDISVGARAVTAVPVGTTAYTSYVNVSAASSSAAGALTMIALLGFFLHGYQDLDAQHYERRGLFFERSAPELAADRLIHEQDCSKPIENPGANLRCK